MRKLKNLLFLVVILTALDVNAFKMEDGPMTIGDRVKPEASSILMLESKTLGLLPPRMTESEREAIVAPVIGLSIYNTDTLQWNTFNGAIWGPSSGGGGADHPLWTPSTLYGVGAIIVDDVGAFKVYRANTAHTSDPVVFINDIANWDELSDLTLLGGTPGAVNFLDATSKISEDPANFFWDDILKTLGIGTSIPVTKIHAIGIGGNTSTGDMYAYTNNAAAKARWRIRRARGSEATPARLQDNDIIGSVEFDAHNGTNFTLAAQIIVNTPEQWSAVLGSSNMEFFTNQAGAAGNVLAMTINSDQTVDFTNTISATRIIIDSTTEGSRPCPDMTEDDRDAIGSPTASDCVYNTTTNKWNVFDGTVWGEVGGGLSKWTATTAFITDEVVWEAATRKIYRSLADFTSGGTFVPGNWEEIGIPSPGDGLEFVGATTVFRVQLDTTGVNSEPYLERSAANGMRAKVLDEDNLVSDSDLHLATQQSIKAYVDSTTGALAPTFQDVYDNSAPALFTLDGTNNGLEIRDNGTPIGVNLFSIEDSASAVEYFKVDVSATNTLALNTTGVHTVSGQSDIDDVTINGNTISTNNGNLPLLLTPDGTGQIEASSDFVFKASALFDEIASTASTIGATQHAIRFDSTSSIFLKENNAGDILPVDFNEIDENNLLLNRSFELFDIDSGWTLVTGTAVAETTTKIEGVNSIEIPLTAQTLDFSQVISIDQYDQKLVEFSCEINSTENLEVCAMDDAVELQCIPTIGNDKWVRYGARMQVISGNSYGIKIKSSGNITDSVFIDACKFTSDPKMFVVDQEENNFTSNVDSAGAVTKENVDFLDGDCNRTGAGLYTCDFIANKFSSAPNITLTSTSGNRCVRVVTVTDTSVDVNTLQCSTGTSFDAGFVLEASRADSDYRQKTTFISTPANSGTEHVFYSGFTSRNGSAFVLMKTEEQNTSASMLSVTNTDHTRFTAIKETSVVVTVSGSRAAGASDMRVQIFNSSDVLLVRNEDSTPSGNNFGNASLTYKLQVGDYVIFLAGDNLLDDTRTHFSIKAQPVNANFLLNIPINIGLNIEHDAAGRDTIGSTTAYKTRDINAITGIFGSISANQLTLPKGSYILTVNTGVVGDCDNVSFAFENITDTSFEFDKIVGNSAGAGDNNDFSVTFSFEIDSSKVFEFQTKAANASCVTENLYDSFLLKVK